MWFFILVKLKNAFFNNVKTLYEQFAINYQFAKGGRLREKMKLDIANLYLDGNHKTVIPFCCIFVLLEKGMSYVCKMYSNNFRHIFCFGQSN